MYRTARLGNVVDAEQGDLAPGAVLARSGGPGGPRADKVAAALADYLRGRKAKFAPVSAPLSPRAGRQGRLLDDGGGCSSPIVTRRAADAGRKMGEMLAATPRRSAKYSKGGGSKGSRRLPLLGAPPSLSDLGHLKTRERAGRGRGRRRGRGTRGGGDSSGRSKTPFRADP